MRLPTLWRRSVKSGGRPGNPATTVIRNGDFDLVDSDVPRGGEVLIAGTNDHLAMITGGSFRYTAEPVDTPYRPSVDVLFGTLASHWNRKGVRNRFSETPLFGS